MIESKVIEASGMISALMTCDMDGCRSRIEVSGNAYEANLKTLGQHGWRHEVVIDARGTRADLCPQHWANFSAGNGEFPITPPTEAEVAHVLKGEPS